MSKINVNKVLNDLNGEPVKLTEDKEVTFADIALISLNASFEDEKNLDFKEKADRFELMCKIHSAKEKDGLLDVESEAKTLMKKLIGKMWNPLIVGRSKEIIEEKPIFGEKRDPAD